MLQGGDETASLISLHIQVVAQCFDRELRVRYIALPSAVGKLLDKTKLEAEISLHLACSVRKSLLEIHDIARRSAHINR